MDIGDNVVGAICGASVFLIPISAIIGGYWTKIVKQTQQHREEMARLQFGQRTSLDDNSHSELNALRQELAALRDTTTQYDMSVERNMHEVLQRLQSLEAKNAPQRSPQATPTEPAPTPRATVYSPPIETSHNTAPEETPLRIQTGG